MFGRNGGDVLAVEHDTAPIGVFQTGDQAQHRGFATAGGAENGEEFAVVNRQFKIGNDGFAIERFAQGMQFNKGCSRGCLSHLSYYSIPWANADRTATGKDCRSLRDAR